VVEGVRAFGREKASSEVGKQREKKNTCGATPGQKKAFLGGVGKGNKEGGNRGKKGLWVSQKRGRKVMKGELWKRGGVEETRKGGEN